MRKTILSISAILVLAGLLACGHRVALDIPAVYLPRHEGSQILVTIPQGLTIADLLHDLHCGEAYKCEVSDYGHVFDITQHGKVVTVHDLIPDTSLPKACKAEYLCLIDTTTETTTILKKD